MQKINRLGTIQRKMLLVFILVFLFLGLLIGIMTQMFRQNEQLLNDFIRNDFNKFSQFIALDRHTSRISTLASELSYKGNPYSLQQKITLLKQEIEYLKKHQNQTITNYINDTFIRNLLSTSQEILTEGKAVINYTADVQSILFSLDNVIQHRKDDIHYPTLNYLMQQFTNAANQDITLVPIMSMKILNQLEQNPSPLFDQTKELFYSLIDTYSLRNKHQQRSNFLRLHFNHQSNLAQERSITLLTQIQKNNEASINNIAKNIYKKQQQIFILTILILLMILLLLYVTIGDFGSSIHKITTALVKLSRGDTTPVILPTVRKDEIGDLSRSYKAFEQHLTSLSKVSKKLSEQNQMMQTIFNTMRDGLSVFDAKGNLISWNHQYLDLMGLNEDIIKKNTSIFALKEHLRNNQVRFVSQEGKTISYESTVQQRYKGNYSFEKHYPDGRIIESRSSTMNDGGFITLHLDQTSRRVLEKKYQQAQKLEAVGHMANGIAHDFNNFLAVIYGNVEILLHQDTDPSIKDKLKQIKRISLSAQEMIERLLIFARKKSKLQTVFDVNAIVNDIHTLMAPLLKSDNIRLSVQTYHKPLWICANIAEMESAILNLISNSQKAITSNGTITLQTKYQDNLVEIWVIDDGVGMDEATVARVFEPFYSNSEHQGTGLGLSMVYGAVKRAKGDVTIKSLPKQGCMVKMTFDYVDNHKDITTTDTANNAATTEAKVILIVDDQAHVRSVLSQQLRTLGHNILEASDGIEAMEYIKKSNDIRLVISDIMMPNMDGIALAEAIEKYNPSLPVVFISGGNESNQEQKHAYEIIRKPWRKEEIQAIINRYLA